jgi:archaellum biogenesis ATPase FlaH
MKKSKAEWRLHMQQWHEGKRKLGEWFKGVLDEDRKRDEFRTSVIDAINSVARRRLQQEQHRFFATPSVMEYLQSLKDQGKPIIVVVGRKFDGSTNQNESHL